MLLRFKQTNKVFNLKTLSFCSTLVEKQNNINVKSYYIVNYQYSIIVVLTKRDLFILNS